jgi:hypothetical protein
MVMIRLVGTLAMYTMSPPSSTDIEDDSLTSSTRRSIGCWASSTMWSADRYQYPRSSTFGVSENDRLSWCT